MGTMICDVRDLLEGIQDLTQSSFQAWHGNLPNLRGKLRVDLAKDGRLEILKGCIGEVRDDILNL